MKIYIVLADYWRDHNMSDVYICNQFCGAFSTPEEAKKFIVTQRQKNCYRCDWDYEIEEHYLDEKLSEICY